MKAYWGNGNVGDELTPVILEFFTGHKAEWVGPDVPGKLLMCGSIVEFALPGDTIVGSGSYKKEKYNFDDVRVLALRGKNTGKAPVYGSPALLMPLVYAPRVKKTKKLGYIPHLWDRQDYSDYIDVELSWRAFIDELLACEKVISTSLHGVILANAYGIPVEWVESKRVPGAKIKYEDYLTGIEGGIEQAQQNIIGALKQL